MKKHARQNGLLFVSIEPTWITSTHTHTNNMKNTLQLLALGFFAVIMSSCCSLPFGNHENDTYISQKVVKYKTVTHLVDPGPKGGIPYEVTEEVPYEETVRVKAKDCGRCGSSYCPATGKCDIVSRAVLRRATAQGGTGEPHMGLIPTMKILAK